MWQAFVNNPVTIVLREDITTHIVDGNDPFGEVKTGFTGQQVYGYVYRHAAGSGYRIIMGKWFLGDPDPMERAQTIYHELTHKVLSTRDHVYGIEGCIKLPPSKALTNADNWAYYAMSFKKYI